MSDIMKHQSMVRINRKFIDSLQAKYNKISVGSYIIERMLYSGVNTGYLCNKYKDYSPFYKMVADNKDFKISVTPNENIATRNSIVYSNTNDTPGLVLSTSRYGHSATVAPLYGTKNTKIMLLSFFNANDTIKSGYCGQNIFFERHWVLSEHRFPSLLEYALDTLSYGHVHMEVDNKLLLSEVDLDDTGYNPK